ncbi:MAG TPA: DNA methyltransferase [Candidatus Eisenbacteria bacterium]|nr:DNA methyltransferase [Candidatus Eisenbacteria bacterium]
MTEKADHNLTYVFIAGKNWKLSLAEVLSYLRARSCTFSVINVSKSFFLTETQNSLNPAIINDLGGIIKIGRVITSISKNTVTDAFVKRDKQARIEMKLKLSQYLNIDEIFRNPKEKLVFGVSVYLRGSCLARFSHEMHRFLGSALKAALKTRGIRSDFMGFPKQRKLPQLSHVEVLKKGLIENSAEILFCVGESRAFVASTIAVHNPFEFQKRDIEKPAQRKILSIPPRLAKIMVNLASCLPGMVILDPFCGVGTILQEAMLGGGRVIGLDIDPWCVRAAKKNLEWIRSEYKLDRPTFRVLRGDSRHLVDCLGKESVDCIVTEPDLGPVLRHPPTESHARSLVNSLRPLYEGFMESAYGIIKNGASLVFVTPYFRTRSETFVSLSIDKKAASLGFEKASIFTEAFPVEDVPLTKEFGKGGSFIEIDERQLVGREIHVFRKC